MGYDQSASYTSSVFYLNVIIEPGIGQNLPYKAL